MFLGLILTWSIRVCNIIVRIVYSILYVRFNVLYKYLLTFCTISQTIANLFLINDGWTSVPNVSFSLYTRTLKILEEVTKPLGMKTSLIMYNKCV